MSQISYTSRLTVPRVEECAARYVLIGTPGGWCQVMSFHHGGSVQVGCGDLVERCDERLRFDQRLADEFGDPIEFEL
jgi:hypothetical protein